MSTPSHSPEQLLELACAAKGFMPAEEGEALFRRALERLPSGPVLEVGTYCGKSALYFGAAARSLGPGHAVLTVDHHRGSEENQAGWEHHDPTLVDPATGLMDTLPTFRRTLAEAGLEREVTAILGHSTEVASWWRTPLSLLFIDGGHGEQPVIDDYRGWVRWVMSGGLLLIHDVFADPADGGQAPYRHLYRRALDSGGFTEVDAVGSLRVLRRDRGDAGDAASVGA